MTEDEGRYFREGYEQGKREGVATRFNTYDVQLKEYKTRIAELEKDVEEWHRQTYRANERIAELEEIILEARQQCLERDHGTAYMTLIGANIKPKGDKRLNEEEKT